MVGGDGVDRPKRWIPDRSEGEEQTAGLGLGFIFRSYYVSDAVTELQFRIPDWLYNKTEAEISLAKKMKQNCDNDPALSHNSKVAAATITKKTKAIIVFINLRAVSEKEVY